MFCGLTTSGCCHGVLESLACLKRHLARCAVLSVHQRCLPSASNKWWVPVNGFPQVLPLARVLENLVVPQLKGGPCSLTLVSTTGLWSPYEQSHQCCKTKKKKKVFLLSHSVRLSCAHSTETDRDRHLALLVICNGLLQATTRNI